MKSIFTSFQRYTRASFDVWCIAYKREDPYMHPPHDALKPTDAFTLRKDLASSCWVTASHHHQHTALWRSKVLVRCKKMNSLKSHNAQKKRTKINIQIQKWPACVVIRLSSLALSLSYSEHEIYFFPASLRVSFDRKIFPQLHNARGIIFLRVDELAVNRRKILYVCAACRGERGMRHISLES